MFKVGDRIRLISNPVRGIREIGDVMTVIDPLPGCERAEVVCHQNTNGDGTWAPVEYFELVETNPFIEKSPRLKEGRMDLDSSGNNFYVTHPYPKIVAISMDSCFLDAQQLKLLATTLNEIAEVLECKS